MTQYNTFNVKLSDSKLIKLKLGINRTKVALDSDDENNFPHKLLLTKTQILEISKDFKSNSSANVKLPKTQLHKIEK